MSEDKIWGGRFKEKTDFLMEQFSNSLHFDYQLFEADIAVNKAWAYALVKVGVYTQQEAQKIEKALDEIALDFADSRIGFPPGVEDIHSATERWLTDRLGDIGARIHTGRSRNDQVVTDLRLFLRGKIDSLQKSVISLLKSLIMVAEKHIKTVFPGQTHLRQAQPISFALYLLAMFFQLHRDLNRVREFSVRNNEMPLGSGALAGAAFEIDRFELAKRLGFDKPTENSYDATSDRDFVNELHFCCSQIMIHLSRVAEDFIIWSSEAFSFIEIDEKYSTGSSIMPQKKNPDSMELIRGKTSRTIGNMMSSLSLLKGVPTAYVRDLQEDKEPLFDSLKMTQTSLDIFDHVVKTLKINDVTMIKSLNASIYATDLADYLVRKGLPFRKAHEVIGCVVAWAESQNKSLDSLSLKDFKSYSLLFDSDIFELFNPIASINKRNIYGGTGIESIKKQLVIARGMI